MHTSSIYSFPAVRGIQAGREYYVVQCPVGLIPKVFLFNEKELNPELRAQRSLNRARVPEIARYIVENPEDYVLSAVTASIDGDVVFKPLNGEGGYADAGHLHVPMSSRILINDGQHRRAAIEEALRSRPELAYETIAVVFFLDAGLKRSQQMFADLNKHAVRPTLSLGILYDHRDSLAHLCRDLARTIPLFRERIDFEKTTISNRSTKLFTLSALYQATQSLLGKTPEAAIGHEDQAVAAEYWTTLSKVIPEWQSLITGHVSAAHLRAQFVHSHGVALQAMGRAGGDLVVFYPSDWPQRLSALGDLDWRRANTSLWEGRALVGGRMSKAYRHVLLTTATLKRVLKLPLSADEERVETSLMAG